MHLYDVCGGVIFSNQAFSSEKEFIKYAIRQNTDFRYASLKRMDLSDVDFRGTYFPFTSFRGSTLWNTNFEGCDLSTADLHNVKLNGANIKDSFFTVFQILKIDLYDIESPSIIRDLMILDAQSHPNPKLFDEYKEYKDNCPYTLIRSFDRVVPNFNPDPKLWIGWDKAKNKTINTYQLCKRIFKELNIKV